MADPSGYQCCEEGCRSVGVWCPSVRAWRQLCCSEPPTASLWPGCHRVTRDGECRGVGHTWVCTHGTPTGSSSAPSWGWLGVLVGREGSAGAELGSAVGLRDGTCWGCDGSAGSKVTPLQWWWVLSAVSVFFTFWLRSGGHMLCAGCGRCFASFRCHLALWVKEQLFPEIIPLRTGLGALSVRQIMLPVDLAASFHH